MLHYTMLAHYWKYGDSLSQLRLIIWWESCTAPWVLQVGRSNYTARCFMLDYEEKTLISWKKLEVGSCPGFFSCCEAKVRQGRGPVREEVLAGEEVGGLVGQ